jgi:hypothetical protein
VNNAADTNSQMIIERTLRTVFPDDISSVGDEYVAEIAGDPTRASGSIHRPELGGEQADLGPILDLLRDGAQVAYYTILIYLELRKQNPNSKPPTPDEVKDETNKRIKEGRLKVSARVLKYVDQIIRSVTDAFQQM